MNLLQNITLGSISYIELIIDWVPLDLRRTGEPEFCQWYVVHIEPAEQTMIQTIEMTVTFGYLDEFLTQFGWTYERQDLRIVHQYNR